MAVGDRAPNAPLGLSGPEWRAFWISLAANAVLFLAIVELHNLRGGRHG